MAKNILKAIEERPVFFDGGYGSTFQTLGLKAGELPETWNVLFPEKVKSVHYSYLEAGSDIIETNTFGANPLKFGAEGDMSLESIVGSGIEIVRQAINEFEASDAKYAGKEHFLAVSIGPLGKLLKPLGDLEFEAAVSMFAKIVKAAEKYGPDLYLIETMNDSLESKAAVLAVKENSSLPVFVTNVYDESARLLTGSTPQIMTAMLEGLGVDAFGMNCSLGPAQMKDIVPLFNKYSSSPIVVNPNAGLPRSENGMTVYDVDPVEFADHMESIFEAGAHVLGGCCGTTPAHIREMVSRIENRPQNPIIKKDDTVICSSTKAVTFGKKPVLIGERINPTGKKRFKQALRDGDIDYIIGEGIKQDEAGADVLDVNVGLPEIDEVEMMKTVIYELQTVTDLPLQVDTTDPIAMEAALRMINGKPMINSVNAKEEVMKTVFPLAAKYGGLVVALTIDEDGIPETSEGRIRLVGKLYENAAKYGIDKKNIIIDPLAMAVSSDPLAALATLETVKYVHEQCGGLSSLGISNISFGLPRRELITAGFFTMALQNGLSAAIMNPMVTEMMKAYQVFCTLSGYDDNCQDYIGFAQSLPEEGSGVAAAAPVKGKSGAESADDLFNAIVKGLKSVSEEKTRELLKTTDSLTIINEYLVPALDTVGKGFEAKTLFLPQLLLSADAAGASFAVIKSELEKSGMAQESKGSVIVATVKGDIHDIGKNIVKVLLENYGYTVIDLGRDVPPEKVVEACIKDHIMLVGLSALMTTTVPAMEETIKQLRVSAPWAKVCVGGAVLTQEYADMIGADKYAKDALETVAYAKEVFGK